MKNPNDSPVVFDRVSQTLLAPNTKARLHAVLMQISHKMLAPVGYLGVSRVHGLINQLLKPQTTTVVRENSFEFCFPSNDYYWNRLLDSSYRYEPEIDLLLKLVETIPFVFVDLGANFGFWSSRVGSGSYGDHPVIAAEASAHCISILLANVNRLNVSVHHKAIDQVSNEKVVLYGERHAGFSIDNSWYGASKTKAGEVVTTTIDDLLRSEGINTKEKPVLLKLDVEGVEKRALLGARDTIAGMSAFVIEDAERQGISDAVELVMTDLRMSVFSLQEDTVTEAHTLDDLLRFKASAKSLQATGLNLVATKSDFWQDKLRSAQGKRRLS